MNTKNSIYNSKHVLNEHTKNIFIFQINKSFRWNIVFQDLSSYILLLMKLIHYINNEEI
jgi:hypothetical protein